MSYQSISQAATDQALRARIAACIAQEGAGDQYPTSLADRIQWQCCGEPGWGEAWESALAADPPNPDPGNDPGVIPDAWILSAVQKHLPASPEAT